MFEPLLAYAEQYRNIKSKSTIAQGCYRWPERNRRSSGSRIAVPFGDRLAVFCTKSRVYSLDYWVDKLTTRIYQA